MAEICETGPQFSLTKKEEADALLTEPGAVWEALAALPHQSFPAVQESVRDVAQWHLIRFQDLEALVTLARQAKDWMAVHAIKG